MFDSYWKRAKDERRDAGEFEKFTREYFGRWISRDELFTKAYRAWLSYYDQLEENDQKICRARDPQGLALPMCGDEVRRRNQKARLLRQELLQPLIALQIPQETERAARDLALREHKRKWRKK